MYRCMILRDIASPCLKWRGNWWSINMLLIESIICYLMLLVLILQWSIHGLRSNEVHWIAQDHVRLSWMECIAAYHCVLAGFDFHRLKMFNFLKLSLKAALFTNLNTKYKYPKVSLPQRIGRYNKPGRGLWSSGPHLCVRNQMRALCAPSYDNIDSTFPKR